MACRLDVTPLRDFALPTVGPAQPGCRGQPRLWCMHPGVCSRAGVAGGQGAGWMGKAGVMNTQACVKLCPSAACLCV